MNLKNRLKPRNEKQNPTTALVVTMSVMYIISGVLLLFLALLLYKLDLSEAVVRIGIIVVYIASGFFGGFFIGRKMQDKKYIWGLAAGVMYFVLLFLLSFLFGRGMTENAALDPVKAFTTLILCAVSGMAGGMFS